MPIFEIQAPDGKTYQIEGPNEEGAIDALQQHLRATGTPSGEAPSTAGTGAPASTPSSPPAPAPEGGQEMGVMGQAAQWLMGGPPEIRKQKVEEWAKKAQRFNSGGPSGAENMLQAITFNRLDDAARLVGADDFANRVNENQTQFRENHPLLSTAYEIGGSMIPMALGGMAIPRLAGMATAKIPMAAQMMTQGGKVAQALPAVVREGAKYGGLGAATSAAYSSGEEGNTAGDVLSDTLWGGALGGAMGVAGQKLAKRSFLKKATKQKTKTADQIEALRRPYYDNMKKAVVKPNVTDDILTSTANGTYLMAPDGSTRLFSGQVSREAHPYTTRIKEILKGNTSTVRNKPGPVRHKTLEDLQEITQKIDEFVGVANGNDRDMLLAMKDKIKQRMVSLGDNDFITPEGSKVVSGMKRAWSLDKKKRRVEVFEKIARDARKSKSPPGEVIQEAFLDVIDNKNNKNLFTKAEWDAINKLAKAPSGRKALAMAAELSPNTVKGLVAQVLANSVSFGFGATVAGAGVGARVAHNDIMKRGLKEMTRMASTGTPKSRLLKAYKPRKWPTGVAVATGGQVGNE